MTELLSDDETRAVFAEFRSAALVDVRPPGPTAARRQRHRRAVASAAAGVTIVAVGGGIASAVVDGGPTDVPDPGLAAPSASAAPSPAPPVALYPQVRDDTLVMVQKGAKAGRQKLVIRCSGTGSGEATLAGGGVTATAQVDCGTPPIAREIEIDLPRNGVELSLRIEWAPGHQLRDTAEGWALAVWGPE